MPTRRSLIAGGLATLLPLPGMAATSATGVERFPLWPDAPPGGTGRAVADQWVRRSPQGEADDIAWPHVATPMLIVCPAAKPTGAAVLLIPGGGYARVATGRNPSGIARWFAGRGVTAFELLYRLPHDHWAAGPDAPLQDAQRAMRLIRTRAGAWGIDPANVAAMGFSAGGHVAGRLATRFALPTYQAVDAADAQPARPLVAGLMFPVISMLPPVAHAQSRRELLGTTPDEATSIRYSVERDLPADAPPTLLGHAADDPVVPVANSVVMFQALHARAIPAELYIIEKGGHGPPLIGPDGQATLWLERFALFARTHGLRI